MHSTTAVRHEKAPSYRPIKAGTRTAAAAASVWIAVVLFLVGVLACYVAFALATSVYQGSLYKVVLLPLVMIGFFVFALWPAGAWRAYGWFFAFFDITP